jgi:O-antigen/teichoic acid export membrane protein
MSKERVELEKSDENTSLIRNSLWGIGSNVLQNLFVSLFFVIITRKYLPAEIADFFVANTLYQFVAAFSAMGLGQWFIREYMGSEDKQALTSRFLKMQVVFGFIFYGVAIVIAFILYRDPTIRILTVIFGINVLFDNVIYGIKNLNIAEYRQEKTFVILIGDAFFRLLAGSLLFIYPIPVIWLTVILVAIRFVTLNLFLKLGASGNMNLKSLVGHKLSRSDLMALIKANWVFVVIGSISIVFWRISGIVVSKMLTDLEIAHYEISFRIFSLAQVIPLVASASVYPMLVKKYESGGLGAVRKLYRTLSIYYFLYGLLCYTFIFSFSEQLIPFIFGSQYQQNHLFTNQMFLTMLLFPTVLLQANLIVAVKEERIDMLLNVIVLLINMAGCIGGIYFDRSLSVVNFSIFTAFIVFQVLQDIFLVRKKLSVVRDVLLYYIIGIALVVGFVYLKVLVGAVWAFVLGWIGLGILLLPLYKFFKEGFRNSARPL